MKVVAFILYRTAEAVNDFAQYSEVRARADVERLTSQMVGNIDAVTDLIIYRSRHRGNRLAAIGAVVPVSRQNLVNRRFIRVKIAHVARAVPLNQIIHRRRLPRGRPITASNMQVISRPLMITVG